MELSVQESELNTKMIEETAPAEEVQEAYKNLATIRRIATLTPIEGADRIELATMEDLSWQVVVQKDLHDIGDPVIYIQIDTIVPATPTFDFLKDRHYRVRSIRLKKQLSQGLILPMRDFDNDFYPHIKGLGGLLVGDDMTDLIGVRKFEKPVPANLRGRIKGNFPTHLVPKTDEERIQGCPRIIEELNGVKCYVSLKLDGTSATYLSHNPGLTEPETHVCSRNLSLKPPEPEDEGNVYWKMEKKYDLLKKLTAQVGYAIQGEICGPGIGGNKMGLSEIDFFLFNVYSISERKYLNFDQMKSFAEYLGVKTVPIVDDNFVFGDVTVQDLLGMADNQTYEDGSPAEGVVIRPVVETYSHYMKGRVSFKVVSNKFLLHHNE